MNDNKISVLVSYPDHFEVVEITRDLDSFQKLVGGFIENVPRPSPGSGWFAYCNEEGKYAGLKVNNGSTDFLDKLYHSENAVAFSAYDRIVGNVVWMTDSDDEEGHESSFPIDYIQRFTATYVDGCWKRKTLDVPVITVLRDGKDIWVFDQQRAALIPQQVAACVRAARSRPEHGTIEVWSGITPAKWTELRVEIMDDVTGINLHDERNDRSYG